MTKLKSYEVNIDDEGGVVEVVLFSDHEKAMKEAIITMALVEKQANEAWKLEARQTLRLIFANKGIGDHENKEYCDEVFGK